MLDSQIEYIPVLIMLAICSAAIGGMLTLNFLLGPKRKSAIKNAPFESGEVQIHSPKRRFSVKFYLVGIFFIVFDIEAVFLFPWATLYRQWLRDPAFAWVAFGEMFLFLGILSLGLLYVWRRGALEWD